MFYIISHYYFWICNFRSLIKTDTSKLGGWWFRCWLRRMQRITLTFWSQLFVGEPLNHCSDCTHAPPSSTNKFRILWNITVVKKGWNLSKLQFLTNNRCFAIMIEEYVTQETGESLQCSRWWWCQSCKVGCFRGAHPWISCAPEEMVACCTETPWEYQNKPSSGLFFAETVVAVVDLISQSISFRA